MVIYILAGVFGYAIFANAESLGGLCDKTVLDGAQIESNTSIEIGKFAILISVFATAPLCVLPTKNMIEELIFGSEEMTNCQNFTVTFAILLVAWVLDIIVPDVGTAMQIVGAFFNPIAGFIIPVMLHWPTVSHLSKTSSEKLMNIFIVTLILATSIMSFIYLKQESEFSEEDMADPDIC